MSLLLIIIILIVLFGGGGYYGYRGGYYGGGGISLIGLLLIVLVLWLLFGSGFANAQMNINGYGLFIPDNGQGKTISATTTSSSVSWSGAFIASTEIYAYNVGTDLVFLRCGTGAQTATTSDLALPAGLVRVFSKGNKADTCAVRANASTATVYLITGFGR